MRRQQQARSANSGYVLVAVLSVMLILAGLLAAASVLVRSVLHSARLGDEDVAMTGIIRGGLEITAYQLLVLKVPPRLVDGRRVRLAGATIVATIADEAGKIDLNGADPKLLLGLFSKVMDDGSAAALVSRVVAFRGDETKDAQPPAAPPSIGPSQDTAVSTQPPQGGAPPVPAPARKKRRGFQSVDQLRDFPDVTRSDLKALTPSLTVFNPDGKVDIVTAREEVLRALPGLTRPKIEEILLRRDGADKAGIEALQAMLGEAIAFAKIKPGPAYSVRIAAATPSGKRQVVDAVIAASKSPNEPFYVLDWRE